MRKDHQVNGTEGTTRPGATPTVDPEREGGPAGEFLDTLGPVPLRRWARLQELGVDAAVTTRVGGVSTGRYRSLDLALHVGDDSERVLENRARAAAAFGSRLDDLVLGQQVHGGAVARVGEADRGRGTRQLESSLPGVDALVTTSTAVVPGVLIADCVPAVLVDPARRVLALAHAGWRGAAAGVLGATVAAMADLGADPSGVTAVIGPAVAPERYEVDLPVVSALRPRLGDDQSALSPVVVGDDRRWHLDLPAVARRLLVNAGVPAARVHLSPTTTADRLLFSHRGARGWPCGRFGLFARLRG